MDNVLGNRALCCSAFYPDKLALQASKVLQSELMSGPCGWLKGRMRTGWTRGHSGLHGGRFTQHRVRWQQSQTMETHPP